jgi:hypothetical protein
MLRRLNIRILICSELRRKRNIPGSYELIYLFIFLYKHKFIT